MGGRPNGFPPILFLGFMDFEPPRRKDAKESHFYPQITQINAD
jgi:hypothetical protein